MYDFFLRTICLIDDVVFMYSCIHWVRELLWHRYQGEILNSASTLKTTPPSPPPWSTPEYNLGIIILAAPSRHHPTQHWCRSYWWDWGRSTFLSYLISSLNIKQRKGLFNSQVWEDWWMICILNSFHPSLEFALTMGRYRIGLLVNLVICRFGTSMLNGFLDTQPGWEAANWGTAFRG